jgi:hypothetical protein
VKPIVARLHRRAASSNHDRADDAHISRFEPRVNAGEMQRTPNDATKVTNGVTLGEDDPTSNVERSEPIPPPPISIRSLDTCPLRRPSRFSSCVGVVKGADVSPAPRILSSAARTRPGRVHMELHKDNRIFEHGAQRAHEPRDRPDKVVLILGVGDQAGAVRDIARQGEQEEEEGEAFARLLAVVLDDLGNASAANIRSVHPPRSKTNTPTHHR